MSSYDPNKHKVIAIDPALITDREFYKSIYISLSESARFLHRKDTHLQYVYGRFHTAYGRCPIEGGGKVYVCKSETEFKEAIFQAVMEN